jgi:hypothetical protein
MSRTSRALGALVVVVSLAAAAAAIAEVPLSRAKAEAVAKAGNLTLADLPGFEISAPGSSGGSTDPREDARFARCAGTVPGSKALASESSKEYTRETEDSFTQVSSSVQLMKSSALVRKDIKAAKTRRFRKCFGKALRREVESEAVPVKSLTLSLLHPDVPNGVGYRIKLVVSRSGVTVPIFTDLLVGAEGPAETGVLVVSALTPPVRSDENRLLTIVRTRVNAELNKDAII